MRIGIHAAQAGRLADPAAVRAVAVAAEQVGYSAIWAGDRPDAGTPAGTPAGPPTDLDPLAVLTASATVTSRIRLGAGVLAASRYEPAVLVRAVRSLDVLSDDRLTVGLRAPAEVVAAHLDALRAGDAPGARALPVLVAATSEPDLDLVARRADGWIAESLPLTEFEDLRCTLHDRARAHGRDPAGLDVVVRADITVDDVVRAGDRPVFTGVLDQVVDDIVAVARLGADEVILHLTRDCSLDDLLGTYADLTEAVGAQVPILR